MPQYSNLNVALLMNSSLRASAAQEKAGEESALGGLKLASILKSLYVDADTEDEFKSQYVQHSLPSTQHNMSEADVYQDATWALNSNPWARGVYNREGASYLLDLIKWTMHKVGIHAQLLEAFDTAELSTDEQGRFLLLLAKVEPAYVMNVTVEALQAGDATTFQYMLGLQGMNLTSSDQLNSPDPSGRRLAEVGGSKRLGHGRALFAGAESVGCGMYDANPGANFLLGLLGSEHFKGCAPAFYSESADNPDKICAVEITCGDLQDSPQAKQALASAQKTANKWVQNAFLKRATSHAKGKGLELKLKYVTIRFMASMALAWGSNGVAAQGCMAVTGDVAEFDKEVFTFSMMTLTLMGCVGTKRIKYTRCKEMHYNSWLRNYYWYLYELKTRRVWEEYRGHYQPCLEDHPFRGTGWHSWAVDSCSSKAFKRMGGFWAVLAKLGEAFEYRKRAQKCKTTRVGWFPVAEKESTYTDAAYVSMSLSGQVPGGDACMFLCIKATGSVSLNLALGSPPLEEDKFRPWTSSFGSGGWDWDGGSVELAFAQRSYLSDSSSSKGCGSGLLGKGCGCVSWEGPAGGCHTERARAMHQESCTLRVRPRVWREPSRWAGMVACLGKGLLEDARLRGLVPCIRKAARCGSAPGSGGSRPGGRVWLRVLGRACWRTPD